MTVENSVGPFPTHQLTLMFANNTADAGNKTWTARIWGNQTSEDLIIEFCGCDESERLFEDDSGQNCNVRKIPRIRLCIFFSKLTGNREGEGHSWKKRRADFKQRKTSAHSGTSGTGPRFRSKLYFQTFSAWSHWLNAGPFPPPSPSQNCGRHCRKIFCLHNKLQ